MNKSLDLLLKVPELHQLLANCPYRLLAQMESVYYANPDQFHLAQGENYPFVYILVKGSIEIFLISRNQRKIVLDTYQKAGAFIGEQEAILDLPYSASVRNLDACYLLKLPKQTFLQWLAIDQQFSQSFLRNQCEQVHHLTNKAAQYTLYNAKEQVALALLKRYKRQLPITKIELQRYVATTNRHLNRILSDLVQQHIISIEQTHIHILKPQQLLFYGEE